MKAAHALTSARHGFTAFRLDTLDNRRLLAAPGGRALAAGHARTPRPAARPRARRTRGVAAPAHARARLSHQAAPQRARLAARVRQPRPSRAVDPGSPALEIRVSIKRRHGTVPVNMHASSLTDCACKRAAGYSNPSITASPATGRSATRELTYCSCTSRRQALAKPRYMPKAAHSLEMAEVGQQINGWVHELTDSGL